MSRVRPRKGLGFGLQLVAASVLVTLAAALMLVLAAMPNARAASVLVQEESRATLQVVDTPPVQPAVNPPLPLSCSGMFSLVFDTSGSFTQGDLDSVTADAKTFVAGVLAVDPSASFRIAYFATSSGVTEGGSSNLATINAAIDAIPAVGGFTNWAAGITAGTAGADHMIVITDGNPNRPGTGGDVSVTAVSAAIEAANAAKLAGVHITVIGVNTSGQPPFGFDADSAMRAGWVASPADVFTTSVSLLPSILDDIAANCLTSIELQKDVSGGDAVAGDFQLKIDNQSAAQDTTIEVTAGPHTISEDAVALYELTDIACVDEQQAEVTVTDGVVNVLDQQNVVCTLTNEFRGAPSVSIDKQVNGGDAEISVPVGTTVAYSWLVTNTGNVTLTNVLVADDTHGVLDADCGTLAPLETCQLSADVALNDAGDVTNVITVTSSEGPTDNDDITVEVYQPTITLLKNVIGGQLTANAFQLTLDAGDVDQGAANAVSPGSHDIGEVAVDLYSLNIIACVDEGQAALTVTSGLITIEDERAVVCTLTNVFEGTPHISIDKRVDGVDGPIGVMVGDSVTYDWTVINDGDVALNNVVVDDDTHNGLDANCGTLAVGQSCQGSTQVTFASPGSVTNIVTVTTTEEVSDSDSVTVSVGFEPPPPAIANLTVVKAGGEPGVSYDFRLTHGALEVVHEFSLDSGESATMILFLNAEWNVVELDAPAGALSSGTCLGDNVLPNDYFTCTVTNPTPPAVEGSSLRITKALTSVDPAAVGELVTFLVEVTAMGDSTLEGVTVVDTFEHSFLEFVSSTSACTLQADVPDADHSSLECVIGTLAPGTPGNPGTASLSIGITFRAIAATTPERTVNSAIAGVDGGSVGPAQADVEIVDVLGVQLPPSGDGSASPVPVSLPWALALAAAATAAAWYGIGRGLVNGRRY